MCVTKVRTPLTFLQILKYLFMGQHCQNDTLTQSKLVCAAYITELVYFPLKITQNITTKSKPLTTKVSTPLNVQIEYCLSFSSKM